MKASSSRNCTVTLSDAERERYGRRLLSLDGPVRAEDVIDRTIQQDPLKIPDYLPDRFADLIFVDPPYNLAKPFNGRAFAARSLDGCEEWLTGRLPQMVRLLKPHGALYLCGDRRSCAAIHRVAQRHFFVGVEIDRDYGCPAEKRLARAAKNPAIQGYDKGVFWERNSRDSGPELQGGTGLPDRQTGRRVESTKALPLFRAGAQMSLYPMRLPNQCEGETV